MGPPTTTCLVFVSAIVAVFFFTRGEVYASQRRKGDRQVDERLEVNRHDVDLFDFNDDEDLDAMFQDQPEESSIPTTTKKPVTHHRRRLKNNPRRGRYSTSPSPTTRRSRTYTRNLDTRQHRNSSYERRTFHVQTQTRNQQTHQRFDERREESFYPEEEITTRTWVYRGNRTFQTGGYFDRYTTPRYPTPYPPSASERLDFDEILKREELYGKYSEGDLLDLGYGDLLWDYNLTLPEDPHHPLGGENCDYSPCYPATGDLLIGREELLTASSTCGLRRKERFCIVSHLEDKKKCFYCDSREHNLARGLSHRIENIVYKFGARKKTWWQSESGKESVHVQLDLEAEFHFTHLIIKFKTFRPAAMLIERSYDFGNTWQVYRYFAHDCADAYPGVPLGPARYISDVICESRYSDVEPSTAGELIFRVLPPHRLQINDPYSSEVQELLKMTNLRINFTRLHTLGDNLLDQRDEIKEKYYYAIFNMVVRGSCSCYGHASRCVPLNPGQNYPPDMVHGRCVCTHNTKGLNCEQCEDFYNDLPWKPAIGHQTNACKQCNCNQHATRCHFDEAVFRVTGNVSGGVCDDCEHNTMGYHCEHCKHFFYREMARDITDPHACQPCDCDPRGSLDNGMCDSVTDPDYHFEAGRCYCKAHVEGRRCDRCQEGFWNFLESNPEGCQACTCHALGTVTGLGCNQYTGECTCKRAVTGRDCNQCLPEHWGLSEDRDGCHACDCDPGGSYDNHCDVINGNCRCRPHVTGRKCDRPDQGYFAGLMDYLVYEAEIARGCDNCQVIVREPYPDRESSWTGLGFMRVYEGGKLEFDIDNVQTSMEYDIAVRYEPQAPRTWDEAWIIIERDGPVDRDGKCANSLPQDDRKRGSLQSGNRDEIFFPPVCLERGKMYKFILELRRYDNHVETPTATILIDSIVLIPRIDSIPFFHGTPTNELRRQEFERYRCGLAFSSAITSSIPEICKQYLMSIGFFVFGEGLECNCDATGSTSNICDQLGGICRCKPNVVGRRCDRCAPGTYGFGPNGCRACDCDSVGSLDNFCDGQTGNCKCRQNTFGRQCDECQPGFWNYPSCRRCECNGHADTCDSKTGGCLECQDFTTGESCDRCLKGYYGDPRSGINIQCRPCPCPGLADSGHSFADTCQLDTHLQTVVCHCQEGYAGERCDRCANNYFGYPESPGGSCEKCSCSNNIDILQPGNCDSHSGECLQCLFNTEGFNCDRCKSGFYGDAINQLCRECVCNLLGTDQSAGPCDRINGRCPCLPNVVGQECNECAENHWKLASGTGCERCSCDRFGSVSEQCHPFDGQCECKHGFGGRQCNECQQNYWGDPNIECRPCNCDRAGSSTLQCHRNNGSCVCLPGIGGDRCDQCARGFTGQAPYCDTCGECFDNWDHTIGVLRDETYRLIEVAKTIQQTGSTGGAYSKQFQEMEEKITEINKILSASNISSVEIDGLQKIMDQIRMQLQRNTDYLREIDDEVVDTTNRIDDAKLQLNDLNIEAKETEKEAMDLKKKAQILQEANVDGALNVTREAARRSQNAQAKVDAASHDIESSKRERQRTETIITQGQIIFNRTHGESEAALGDIVVMLNHLEDEMPSLNEKVCGALADPCDDVCGGAGCGKCGALSCDDGAVTKAENALSFAEDAKKAIDEKEKAMNLIQSDVVQAKRIADVALDEAQLAFDKASKIHNYSESVKIDLTALLDRINQYLNKETTTPGEIRQIAEEVLAKSISLDPEQIRDLARQINQTIASLTNIDAILKATAGDFSKAKALEDRANKSKKAAEDILNLVEAVVKNLTDAKDAQTKAKDAISKANDEITATESDLVQIKSEASSAQGVANGSVAEVEELKKKLAELRKKYIENQSNVQKASKEAIAANALAMQADNDAKDLEAKYRDAMRKLDDKAKTSGKAKEKAEMLRMRANELAHNVTGKLKELQGMEDEFSTNERKLRDMSAELDELNEQMNSHLHYIEEKSTYYRTCQN